MADEEGEFSGRTVADAIKEAEVRLGASQDNLQIEVITAGRNGVFGFGAEPARVRAIRQQAAAPSVARAPGSPVTDERRNVPAADSPIADSDDEGYDANYDEESDESEAAHGTSARGGEALAQEAAGVLRELLRTMGFVHTEVTVRGTEDPVMLGISGDNLGVLIGRRGDNLSALQFMVNLILSKNRRQWPRVVIDVENYRARREESLRSLAERIAYRVHRQGRPFTLEAMPAGDRRVIHLTLRETADIETYSIGEGVARRVVIAPRRGDAPPREAEDA